MPYVVSRVIDRVRVEIECVHCGALYTVDRDEDGCGDGPKVCAGCENHDCFETLEHKSHSWVETHGLDCGPYEHCSEEWYKCWICGEEYGDTDVERHHERVILKDFFEGFVEFLTAPLSH